MRYTVPVPVSEPKALDLEILGHLLNDAESSATVLATLRLPVNRDQVSQAASRLTLADLDGIFEHLRSLGLVTAHQEASDGYQLAEPGRSFTWWTITEAGRRACDDWDPPQL